MAANDLYKEFKKLNTTEKILLVEDLWDSIDDERENFPVPEWHVNELDKRYSNYQSGNIDLYDWQVVHQEIRKRLK